MDYMITTEQLTKKYKNFTSVNNVSLHIRKGSIYGFLGPNGAGKSTTMKMLLGLTAPTKGSFTIDGKQFPADRIAILKEVGSFIESPSFYANLTGRENLDVIRRILGLPKSAVEDALDLVGLTEFGDRLAKKYSLGMKQRLVLAGALLGRPPILILDEPTNGLDPNQILEIRHLIKAIAEECTVVLSTHILSEVQATCNYIRMIGQGTLVFSGTVDEFDNYILPNTVFATLVAAPPIEELKQLPGVVDVDELGGSNYRLRFSDLPQEMIERVVQTSVAKDWRLTEVRLEKSSLDDIFAELSKIKK